MSLSDKNRTTVCPTPPTSKALLPPEILPPTPISPRQDTQLRHRNERKEDDRQSTVQKTNQERGHSGKDMGDAFGPSLAHR